MKSKKSSINSASLFVKLRRQNIEFQDLCDERDKIVRIIEHHQIIVESLYSELDKWERNLEEMFLKLTTKTDLKQRTKSEGESI